MSNFPQWWALCQQPNNDGRADDTDANDGAGSTRWGWTYPTWIGARQYAGLPASTALFNAMTQAQAGTLAQVYFWNRLGGRQINSGADVSLMDWAWTSGGAVHEIQYHLGIANDGIVGPQTIAAINAAGTKAIPDICTWRIAYYDMLGFRTEYPGLYRRAADVMGLGLRVQSATQAAAIAAETKAKKATP